MHKIKGLKIIPIHIYKIKNLNLLNDIIKIIDKEIDKNIKIKATF